MHPRRPVTGNARRDRDVSFPALLDAGRFPDIDIETGSLAGQLARSGFDPGRPALVSWLGVTMYLTRDAIAQTLDTVGGFAPGTHIVADYMLPAGLRDADGDTYAELVGAASAEQGEPWLSLLSPADMSDLLEHSGFGMIEHVSQRDAVPAALWDRSDSLRPVELSRLAHATVTGK
ncbi:MAG TPA: class I SAM-dependent methyltransferase [Streptosporangiaceae bacterium]|nr:class I SAM-dependent methyltransferase [Streptosporangiaceae bacterium]